MISIHAPAGGATRLRQTGLLPAGYFNSRPCGRGDNSRRTSRRRHSQFQFTPLREGRLSGRCEGLCVVYFNSRPCGRGDVGVYVARHGHTYFNSRPCGRGDRRPRRPEHTAEYFNSRPCGRGDQCHTWAFRQICAISIHAPAGGATATKTR